MNYKHFWIACLVLPGILATPEPVRGQESFNLLDNPGFESEMIPGEDWNRGSNTLATRDSSHRIELDSALLIDHSAGCHSSGVSQGVDPAKFTVGGDYVLSANVRFEEDSGGGGLPLPFPFAPTPTITLIARFHGDPSLDETVSYSQTDDRTWKKIVTHFTIPPVPTGQQSSLRIFLYAYDTCAKTWFDYVQLVESGDSDGMVMDGDDMLSNGCFEDGLSSHWNSSTNVTLETGTSNVHSGTNTLKISGATQGNPQWASQYISLNGQGFEPDMPVYTVSAHLKTVFDGPPPPANTNVGLWDYGNDDDLVQNVLPSVTEQGASLILWCYDDGNNLLRIIKTPGFMSMADGFHERKFSFLLPAGTDSIIVSLNLVNAPGVTALFDNVRLVKNDIVAVGGNALISQVGHNFGVTEAPEPGTSVDVTDYTGNHTLQAAIDDVVDRNSANFGKIVWVPRGTYSNIHRTVLHSGLHLKMHKDALFERSCDPDVPGCIPLSAWHGSFFKNETLGDPVSDIIVEGGGFANPLNIGGSALGISGDRIVCRNFNVHSYTRVGVSAPALYLMGNNVFLHHNTINGAPDYHGIDGIHFWGGSGLHIMCNSISTGDDGIGLFTGESKYYVDSSGNYIRRQELFDRNISAVEVFNNLLDSEGARSFACGLTMFAAQQQVRLSSKVTDIRARNFVGRCGGRNAMISVSCVPALSAWDLDFGPDEVRLWQVQRILVQNADVQGYDLWPMTQTRPPNGLQIITDDVGAVHDVMFENVRVRNVARDNSTTYGQSSVIVQVRKALWDSGDQDLIDRLGHDNKYVRCRNCTFDAQSLGSDDLPDGGEDAEYMFLIDGEMWNEVYGFEHPVWFNHVNTFSPNDPGQEFWRDWRHSDR